MVIPNLPLPVAGNATPSQPATSSVTGKGEGSTAIAGESGGLFAGLLAALQGVVEATVVPTDATEAAIGEEASIDSTLAVPVGDGENADEAGDAVDESTELNAASNINLVAAVVPVVVLPEGSTVVAPLVPQSIKADTRIPVPAVPPTVVDNAAKVGTGANVDAAKLIPANAEPVAQVVRPASSEVTVAAPVSVPVNAGADAVPEVAPKLASQPAPQVPLLTGVKGPAPTVPATPVEPTAQVVPATQATTPAESQVLTAASKPSTLHLDDAKVFAKSEPDAPVPIDFEKAKQSLSVARVTEKSPATQLRKAIEAFAKPAIGQSESIASASRSQAPAFAPVTVGETVTSPVTDVTRVAPVIAPAELGANAPRSVVTPEAPERPTRTSLSDIAQTAVRSVRYLARNGEQRMTLRLIPESLGEVHIEVVSTKDAMSIKLIAESAVVRDAMEAQTHQLRDSLSREGLDVRTITVSEESGSGRGAFHQRDANASRNGERGQSQSGQQPAPDQSSGKHANYAAPRARHEGAFDQVA